jgi:hypothetical protein
LFNILKPQPIVDSEKSEWLFDCFGWLIRNCGGIDELKKSVLVQPTDEFFPQRGARNHDFARAVFRQTKAHARMTDWRCRLVAQEPRPNKIVSPGIAIQSTSQPAAGTFSILKKRAEISYDPDLLSEPMSLVATFAHELAHYRISAVRIPPPGGIGNLEYATDVASIFLGFGIFSANSASNFHQFSGGGTQGWRMRRMGYLSETEVLYVLAIYCAVLRVSHDAVIPHLKPPLRRAYMRALKDVNSKPGSVKNLEAISVHESLRPNPSFKRTR